MLWAPWKRAQPKPNQNHGRAPQAREAAAQRQQCVDSERAGPVGPPLRIPRAGRSGALLLSAGRRKKSYPRVAFFFSSLAERGTAKIVSNKIQGFPNYPLYINSLRYSIIQNILTTYNPI